VIERSAQTPANRRSPSRRREPSVQGTLGVSKTTRKRRKETPVEQQRQYVGIDLHRRRSVIVRMTEGGSVLETVRVENDPLQLSLANREGRRRCRGSPREHLWLVLGG